MTNDIFFARRARAALAAVRFAISFALDHLVWHIKIPDITAADKT